MFAVTLERIKQTVTFPCFDVEVFGQERFVKKLPLYSHDSKVIIENKVNNQRFVFYVDVSDEKVLLKNMISRYYDHSIYNI